MEDHDLLIARQLQEEFDKESAAFLNNERNSISSEFRNSIENTRPSQPLPVSVVDPSWETIDPNPDIRLLFLEFNREYFWGNLAGVEVKWSPRMTLCAGVCSYEGRGGLCSIRLSVPLLKLRPRKDLVETLLHEMIHAYLFVSERDRDRDGHGPNFQKHMHRINKASGANITIYHDFHDEVNSYRQHWWRCNGPCRNRHPYFGFVKRSMNRAPSANDIWWEDHVKTCGGTYTKVKEPEDYGKKKKGGKGQAKGENKADEKGANVDIRNFFGNSGKETGRKGTTGTSKNPASTVTTPSVPHKVNSSGYDLANNQSGLSGSTNHFGRGIWTPEKAGPSQPSLDNAGKTGSWQGTALRNQGNKWTVVETKGDGEAILGAAGKAEAQGSGRAGNVLGRDGGGELSWLARMRRQWAKERFKDSKLADTLSKFAKFTASADDFKTDWDDVAFIACTDTATLGGAKPKTAVVTKPNTTSVIVSDDDSFHASFHVSSCEEDNWPSPEHKSKSWAKEPTVKRTVIDLMSSDEEYRDLQFVSKRVKYQDKTETHSFDSDLTCTSDTALHHSHVKEYNKACTTKQSSTKTGFSYMYGETCENGREMSCHSPLREVTQMTSGANSRPDPTASLEVQAVTQDSFVDCPACGRNVLATDINNHLDACLT